MARFASLFSVATFLLLHRQSVWRAAAQDEQQDGNKAARINCLKEMNEARSLVGLAAFTDGSAKEETRVPFENRAYTDFFCQDVALSLEHFPVYLATSRYDEEREATYMFASRLGTPLDCATAVGYWKKALRKFTGLPSPFAYNNSFYHGTHVRSFVALFNANEKPTIDCALFTCPVKEFVPSDAEGDQGDQQKATATQMGYGISCLTSPPAFSEGKAPYTQEQWQKITEGLSRTGGGASPEEPRQGRGFTPLPSFLAFSAGALAVALL